MLINNIDISSLGVILHDRVITSNKVETAEEWLDGDIQPTYIRQQDNFKTMKLKFLILSPNEEEAYLKISQLTRLLKKATLLFDDLDLFFDVSLINQEEPERLKNGNFIITYSFNCDYAKGEKEIYTTDANMTNSFKLTVLYYQNTSTLVATDAITIRASAFDNLNVSLSDIGIDVDKYLPKYYNHGIATNLGNMDLTYENLQTLKALIINYSPTTYNITVRYYMNDGSGFYNEILTKEQPFTYPQLQNITSIGQIIDAKTYRPDGYRTRIDFDKEITVDNLLLASPISVFYDKIEFEKSKNVVVYYQKEQDDGTFQNIQTSILTFKESQFVEGMTLSEVIPLSKYRPEGIYYNSGYYEGYSGTELITYETLQNEYTINYTRAENTLYVEYYAGVYPDWYRLTTTTIHTKYKDSFNESFDLVEDLNLDLNKYHTAPYQDGLLLNQDLYHSYDDVLNAGVLQVYYKPIDYTIQVHYYLNGPESDNIVIERITINDLMFLSNPILNDIIPITAHRPEGYQFNADLSYNGEVSLSALTQASPIRIIYTAIEEMKSKNIIVRYKKELASAYSTINTSLITVNEADVLDGVRLKDIINLNAYKPDYYENGVVNGTSSTTLITFDGLASSYDVLYTATTYTTPVRYYIDEVNDINWLGSSNITFKVISFEINTTLYDLGLNVNQFKPNYCGDGTVQYSGPVNFEALLNQSSIDIIYKKERDPEDTGDINYPHRFLFLQHNDLGDYEHLHPEWTMNHAYIDTGVITDDMSKLTVIMECERVDENVPLYEVNAGQAYLFGSVSTEGSFFMRYNNQTQFGVNLTGVNTYQACAGNKTNVLTVAEDKALGFGSNAGIYATAQAGYSKAVFTYTQNVATNNAKMPLSLYLFANHKGTKPNNYEGGLAGIGIYSCRIYYDNKLIRDYIPVEFYDKIGDQVAPSNCLYDKITKTFFEDGTSLNSFNIRDDDRYEDTDPAHKIGHCYVNYYKGDQLFQTNGIWFRGDEFGAGKVWDMYERFQVDKLQPTYYNAGIIDVAEGFVPTFDSLNNQIFNVRYEEQSNQIVVKYYMEDAEGIRALIKEENIPINEKLFYSVPTFGDIVRLNKYKPEGYETDFVYTGKKVSMARVLELSPYEIVYKPIAGEVKNYSTVIRYMKKVFGLRTYTVVGTETLTFNQSDFRDGEYIDFYIDFDKYKPEYYLKGEPYQWYLNDERLDKPADLKEVYEIYYLPETYAISVNYYVDSVSEENQVASTSWNIKIDDWEGKIQLPDTIPNEYINKYKPVRCSGGQIVNPDAWYSFLDLVHLEGGICIIYPSLVEPDDPEQASWENKVLYWGDLTQIRAMDTIGDIERVAGKIPYIDLGYRPKEIGRLRVEMVGTCVGAGYQWGSWFGTPSMGLQGNHAAGTLGYTSFFGYSAPGGLVVNTTNNPNASLPDAFTVNGEQVPGSEYGFSSYSKGGFAFFTRIPTVSGFTYTSDGPQSFDGQVWYRASDPVGVIAGDPYSPYNGVMGIFRRGLSYYYDDNYEIQKAFSTYWYQTEDKKANYWTAVLGRTGKMGETITKDNFIGTGDEEWSWISNPYHMVLDAYHNYGSISSKDYDNTPMTYNWENTDNDFFEYREQPKGTISLFQSTDPNTGEVNVMPFLGTMFPNLNHVYGSLGLQQEAAGNPYSGDWSTTITVKINVITGYKPNGDPIYQLKTEDRNIAYATFSMPMTPQMKGCAIWSLKLYDRDKLVRDMIPVAKGDKIYNYIMPDNGLFDKITEIFFGNSNAGGTYSKFTSNATTNTDGKPTLSYGLQTRTIKPEEVLPLKVMYDPLIIGKITENYYDYNNTFIDNQFIDVPAWYNSSNETLENILQFNDFKPDDFHLDGMIDLDKDLSFQNMSLLDIYNLGLANVYYKLRTFTKTIVYYRDNCRVGSKDIFYSLKDIEDANTLADLNIDVDLYYTDEFAHGRIVFDESIIAENNIQAFIDAPSPIVVYDKLTKEEAPNLLYVEYYRGGAFEDKLITVNEESPNYLDCNLDGVVLNPHGAIKYYNHYHSALYEDEKFDYFIPYQVKVINKYAGIHRGPARRYQTLAMIIEKDTYTIIEERNGWGRLKEYPVGWIMLSQTEPITGPGQNPDYDVADETTATIPFAEHIHITKLTIDRLWCYVPAVESWVKAEDISYDQAGRLYNGLKYKVIHLDGVDFSKVSSIEDLGFGINDWVLRFHDDSSYHYDGEYTYEAISNLHEINIVYPETIYNYTCVYYKDNIGKYYTVPGSATIEGEGTLNSIDVRFNINGSIAVYASYGKKCQVAVLDKEERNSSNKAFRKVKFKDIYNRRQIIGWVEASKLTNIVEPSGELVDNELGRASFSCSISDWNPDWDIFIDTSWMVDDNNYPVNPKLYRGVALALTWDYFGFDKNLYKPAGYPDGIYLWNPRSWERDNPSFSFEELIRTGSQQVLYPCFGPNTYKLWNVPNVIGYQNERYSMGNGVFKSFTTDMRNFGLAVPIGGLDDGFNQEYTDNNLENNRTIKTLHSRMELLPQYQLPHVHKNPRDNENDNYETFDTYYVPGVKAYINDDNRIWSGYIGNDKSIDWTGSLRKELITRLPQAKDILEADMSEITSRESPTFVISYYNNYNGEKPTYYIRDERANLNKILNNTDLKAYGLSEKIETLKENKTAETVYHGICLDVQSYENNFMDHYWVPVPKGLWYLYNGQSLRIPDNGLFDLITGSFIRGYRNGDPVSSNWYNPEVGVERHLDGSDGEDLIFLQSQEPDRNNAFYYFQGWNFTSTDVDYIIQIGSKTKTYESPDIYSTYIRELVPGVILPVEKTTSDSANKVVGEWYYSPSQWFETKDTTIYAGTFNKNNLEKIQQTICLLPSAVYKTFYTYTNPETVITVGENSNYSYGTTAQPLTSYYTYTNTNGDTYFFDGALWIPKKYTASEVNEVNKNYAITKDTICYSVPIAKDTYKVGVYLYGERITVPYVATNNTNWAYTGKGWIELAGNTNEVM